MTVRNISNLNNLLQITGNLISIVPHICHLVMYSELCYGCGLVTTIMGSFQWKIPAFTGNIASLHCNLDFSMIFIW